MPLPQLCLKATTTANMTHGARDCAHDVAGRGHVGGPRPAIAAQLRRIAARKLACGPPAQDGWSNELVFQTRFLGGQLTPTAIVRIRTIRGGESFFGLEGGAACAGAPPRPYAGREVLVFPWPKHAARSGRAGPRAAPKRAGDELEARINV